MTGPRILEPVAQRRLLEAASMARSPSTYTRLGMRDHVRGLVCILETSPDQRDVDLADVLKGLLAVNT